MIEFLKSKSFAKHFGIAVILHVAIIWGVLRYVASYTQHGQYIVVPDLRGLSIQQAEPKIKELKLEYIIVDSVFAPEKKRGTIIEQNPAPGVNVKENRTVYLTMNAFNPPKVKLPNMINQSLRQAKGMLQTYGLEVGNLRYVPHFAKDAVLKVMYKGREVEPGFSVVHGERIDLVLGDGIGGEKIPLPDFTGMTRREVLRQLEELSLVPGAEVFDKSVSDSNSAKVYRQIPEWREGAEIQQGRSIDLFFGNRAARDTTNADEE
jgi:beta-lactam-binding protein with PASTA domain